MAPFWDYFAVLAPSVGLALLFWLIMRSLLRADTGEREAQEWARRRREEGRSED